MKLDHKRCFSMLLTVALTLTFAGCAAEKSPNDNDGVTSGETGISVESSYIDSIPKEVYYNGADFTIGWSTPYELNECVYSLEEAASDIVNESVYERNRRTEEKLGITITGNQLCDSWEKIMTTLQTQITAGDCPYDAVCASGVWMFRSSLNSLIYDMSEIQSVDFNHDWWDTEAIGMYSMGSDNIYFASGMINYVDDYSQSCILFNKVLCSDYGVEYPYQLVLDGKWTFDKLYEYILKLGVDLDGNGKYDENDIYGYYGNGGILNTMIAASGENIVLVDDSDGSVSLNGGERLSNVVRSVFDNLLGDNSAVCIAERKLGYEVGNQMFPRGHVLFAGNMMVGMISEYRLTMEDDFGVIPHPKYDEAQQSYSSLYNYVYGTAYAIPITNDDTERIGWILDTMGYYSTDTIYEAVIEKNIITKSTRDEESVDMLKLIFDTKLYELGGWSSTIYENICNMVYSGVNTYSSVIEKCGDATESEFSEIAGVYKFN